MPLPTSPAPLPLDADGLLPPSLFDSLASGPAYLVFAQLRDARIDVTQWDRHAAQFFASSVQLTRPKRYGAAPPVSDAAHVVVTRRNAAPVLRTVFVRARTDDDLRAAERAQGGGGLALLAKRCKTVLLVPVVDPVDADTLFLTALLASVLLGPILSPDRTGLFGARTARAELDKLVQTAQA